MYIREIVVIIENCHQFGRQGGSHEHWGLAIGAVSIDVPGLCNMDVNLKPHWMKNVLLLLSYVLLLGGIGNGIHVIIVMDIHNLFRRDMRLTDSNVVVGYNCHSEFVRLK